MKTSFASRTSVNSNLAGAGSALVLPACMLLSGLAGIVYQICWARQFALVFGTTEVAVTIVLAAYLAGLAVGAWLIQRFLPYIDRPALAYSLLEILIGASACLLVPGLLSLCDWLLLRLCGGRAEPGAPGAWDILIYAAGAFVAVGIPTACMGATLPLLTRHIVENDRQVGRRVGALFAFNTAGAVAGALIAAYWLLPNLALSRCIWSAAGVSCLAAILALAAAGPAPRRRAGFSAAWAAAGRASFSRPPALVWILPLMLLSGAVALLQEVTWTRLLSHVLGSSLRAFSVMLAGFLGGLAIGGGVGGVIARDRRIAVPAFAVVQLLQALVTLSVYLAFNALSPDRARLAVTTLITFALLVPVAICGGATYPLAVRILSRRAEDAASAAARVYAWNTLGAICGALAAGFALVPSLRFEGSIQLAVACSATLAVLSVFLLERPARFLGFAVSGVAIAIVVLFWPPVPTLLRASPLQINNAGRLLYYRVGRAASVVVLQQDDSLAFRTNGLPEALIETRGAAPHLSGEKWMVPLALLARPSTEDMLVVGYGGGALLEDVPDAVKRIDVIEIEPRVIDANVATRAFRRSDPLSDPRVRVIIDDARTALNLTRRKYQAIISQPSHPWTAAAAHLYTREFMLEARSHLSGDGVFVQWMNVRFLDEALLRSLAATTLDVFADVRLYRPDPFTLVFVASPRPLGVSGTLPEAFPRLGINTPEDVFVALAADGQALKQLSKGAPLITDDRNRMATGSAYQPDGRVAATVADHALARFDPLRSIGKNPPELAGLRRGYIATRAALWAAAGNHYRLNTLSSVVDPQSPDGYEINAVRLAVDGDPDSAQDMTRQGLARYPDRDSLRYEYLRPWLTRVARGTAPREVSLQAAKLTGSAQAVVKGTLLASQSRWLELQALEDVLAGAAWGDPWKIDAVLLQAQWRCQVDVTAPARRKLGEDALAIIDEAIAAQPAMALYALRVQSAVAAHRTEAVVESAWEYGHGLFANALTAADPQSGSSDDRTRVRAALKGLLQILGSSAVRDSPRAQEVRNRLTDDLRRLSPSESLQ